MIIVLTFRWVDLLLMNANLVDYVYTVLRDERISLNDPIISTFIELYFPKVFLLVRLSSEQNLKLSIIVAGQFGARGSIG